MASSFIHIGEQGFWARDGFVEAMQLCLIDEIEHSNLEKTKKWLTDYKIELAFQSLPLIYGGMSMGIEGFLSTTEKKKQIVVFIDSVIQKINMDDVYFTGATMHKFRKRAMEILRESEKVAFEDEKDFLENVNNARWQDSNIHGIKNNYNHFFKLLKKLINGEITTTAGSKIDYWDC